MKHIIRKATISDAPALSALARKTFSDTYAAQNTAEDLRLHLERAYTPEKQRSEIDDPAWLTLVAECDGALTAFAQGGFTSPPACLGLQTPAPRKPWEILRFYVDRDWHGKGIAQALMQQAVAGAAVAAADSIWLGVWSKNERARAYYVKSGYRQIGETTFTLGTDPQLDLVMYQPLA
jgi:diamine N-acetyltransferase